MSIPFRHIGKPRLLSRLTYFTPVVWYKLLPKAELKRFRFGAWPGFNDIVSAVVVETNRAIQTSAEYDRYKGSAERTDQMIARATLGLTEAVLYSKSDSLLDAVNMWCSSNNNTTIEPWATGHLPGSASGLRGKGATKTDFIVQSAAEPYANLACLELKSPTISFNPDYGTEFKKKTIFGQCLAQAIQQALHTPTGIAALYNYNQVICLRVHQLEKGQINVSMSNVFKRDEDESTVHALIALCKTASSEPYRVNSSIEAAREQWENGPGVVSGEEHSNSRDAQLPGNGHKELSNSNGRYTITGGNAVTSIRPWSRFNSIVSGVVAETDRAVRIRAEHEKYIRSAERTHRMIEGAKRGVTAAVLYSKSEPLFDTVNLWCSSNYGATIEPWPEGSLPWSSKRRHGLPLDKPDFIVQSAADPSLKLACVEIESPHFAFKPDYESELRKGSLFGRFLVRAMHQALHTATGIAALYNYHDVICLRVHQSVKGHILVSISNLFKHDGEESTVHALIALCKIVSSEECLVDSSTEAVWTQWGKFPWAVFDEDESKSRDIKLPEKSKTEVLISKVGSRTVRKKASKEDIQVACNERWFPFASNVSPPDAPFLEEDDLKDVSVITHSELFTVSRAKYLDKSVCVKCSHGSCGSNALLVEHLVLDYLQGVMGDALPRVLGTIRDGLVMQYVGASLNWVEEKDGLCFLEVEGYGAVSSSQAAKIRDTTISHLGRIHATGILHGDISLRNLRVEPGTWKVWLIDFANAEFISPVFSAVDELNECIELFAPVLVSHPHSI